MQLFIAGGCGDEGRNCFYVEGDRHAFIVDAGTSTDGLDRIPDLTPEQIHKAEYLFITHSHRDHTGAIEYLVKQGFEGPVLMSNQTYRQLHYKPWNTMILDSTAPELELEPGFRVKWGRTGHCAGAVWFHIFVEGRSLFFSGDYRENDTFYRCDAVRGLHADMAVIDAAYSRMDRGRDLRRQVADTASSLMKDARPFSCRCPIMEGAFPWGSFSMRPSAGTMGFICRPNCTMNGSIWVTENISSMMKSRNFPFPSSSAGITKPLKKEISISSLTPSFPEPPAVS